MEIVNGKPKVIKEKLPVDEVFTSDDKKQKVVYDEVAFVLLENGLQLSIEYRSLLTLMAKPIMLGDIQEVLLYICIIH